MKKVTVYREAIEPITKHNVGNALRQRYQVIPSIWADHGWGVNPEQHCLVMPIRCPYGGVRGHITRTLTEPKRCFTYKATAQPWLDWWDSRDRRSPCEAPVVVVEDTISACRLAGLGYQSVALLGTSISNPQAREIAQVANGRPVYLALDRDAFTKALHLAKRHAHIVKFLPVCLTEDIKNMKDDDDIHRLFKRVQK
jgi:hypothetical protein